MTPFFAPTTTPLVLEGRHVRLEPLGPQHLDALELAATDPELWRYLPIPAPTTRQELETWLTDALAQAIGESIAFAIVDRASGQAVGSTRLYDFRRANRAVEIGWTWLGRAAQRSAINSEAKYLLLRHAFEHEHALRVQLKTDARNERSRAAILRLGASFEGILRCERVLWDGHIRDTAYYSVTFRDWPSVRTRLEGMLAR